MRKRGATHTSDLFDDASAGVPTASGKPSSGARSAAAVISSPTTGVPEAADVSVVRPEKAGLADEQFLTDKQVAERYGVSRAAVWRWVNAYPEFPEPHHITPGTTRWYLSELKAHEAAAAQPKPAIAK